jgi:ABC-type polysaccharide/polyol phosphate transport system ATPase subunit
MSDAIITVENLGKCYRLQHQQERQRYVALREVITSKVKGWFGKRKEERGKKNSEEDFWALKDVSFEIKQGEVVGIIGRNGSGKSTLLKILSRITEPTKGRITLNGRVASLLEVGTGFHPELTGRENIYLNGAILGMKRVEIRAKFDEIVAFAEVEKFLDTPVKRYSSGMYVRLAFAVAAHLEPEILVVDEVLAVGDAAFQKKCLGKMDTAAGAGRTILFVSHQMNQIRRLCSRCLWIHSGALREQGATVPIVSNYEAAYGTALENGKRANTMQMGQFLKWEVIEPNAEQSNLITTFGSVLIQFTVRLDASIQKGHHGVVLLNNENQLIWASSVDNLVLDAGLHGLTHRLVTLPLKPGVYHWRVSLYDRERLVDDWFAVPPLVIGTEPVNHAQEQWQGVLNVPCEFASKVL